MSLAELTALEERDEFQRRHIGPSEAEIAEMLKVRGLKVTRLARGVPAGSELEYVDLGTIAHALVDRR